MPNNIKNNIGLNIINLFLDYVKHLFLTGTIILHLAVLIFILSNINPDFSFSFLKFIPTIGSQYKTGTFNMGIEDITKIFLIISFLLWIFISLIRVGLKKTLKINIIISLKYKIILSFVAISLIYISASKIVISNSALNEIFHFTFIIFYIINLFLSAGYFLLDSLSRKILKFTKR
jgi:hypothetical protein